MPSMYTHRLLGDAVYVKINEGKVKEAIDITETVYSIGTSGPDVFFFYHAWPWLRNEHAVNVNGYGSKIHEFHINKMFETMLTMCKENANPFYYAYTAGVLVHWSLDRLAHPYVFNQTGDCIGRSGLLHRKYEMHIDRAMINEFEIDIRKRRPYSFVSYKSTTHEPIYDLYAKVLKDIWQIELDKNDMKQSIKDFYRIQRTLYDPSGSKMKWIGRLERAIKLDDYGTSMIIPQVDNKEWDVLNLKKRTWHHPSTNEPSNKSFLEIFEQATMDGVNLLNLMMDYLDDKIEITKILDYINDGNFHTGLAVEDDMKYFNVVEWK